MKKIKRIEVFEPGEKITPWRKYSKNKVTFLSYAVGAIVYVTVQVFLH